MAYGPFTVVPSAAYTASGVSGPIDATYASQVSVEVEVSAS